MPILSELGLDLSTAHKGIPFNVTLNVPNAETQEALREFQDMREPLELYKRYSNFGDALKEVVEDA